MEPAGRWVVWGGEPGGEGGSRGRVSEGQGGRRQSGRWAAEGVEEMGMGRAGRWRNQDGANARWKLRDGQGRGLSGTKAGGGSEREKGKTDSSYEAGQSQGSM